VSADHQSARSALGYLRGLGVAPLASPPVCKGAVEEPEPLSATHGLAGPAAKPSQSSNAERTPPTAGSSSASIGAEAGWLRRSAEFA
jgi:hypothetical protein